MGDIPQSLFERYQIELKKQSCDVNIVDNTWTKLKAEFDLRKKRTFTQLNKVKTDDLRNVLKKRKLKKSGNKSELINRVIMGYNYNFADINKEFKITKPTVEETDFDALFPKNALDTVKNEVINFYKLNQTQYHLKDYNFVWDREKKKFVGRILSDESIVPLSEADEKLIEDKNLNSESIGFQ